MPRSHHHHARKAHRDDTVTNALANLIEDMAGAQALLDNDEGLQAKDDVHAAVERFRKVANPGIRDLIVAVDLGRIRLTLDYSDDLGEISATYVARRSWN